MNKSMSREEIQQLIAGYVLYDLSPEEFETLQRLAATDLTIAQEIAELQEALESAYGPAEVQPPEGLWTSILAAQRAPKAAPSHSSPPSLASVRSRRRRWGTGLGAMAAALIVGLGVSNYALWRSLQATQAQRDPAETITVFLEPTSAENPAVATVILNPDDLEATLTIENLPPLPEGQVYVLWTVLQPDAPFTTDDKDSILTNVFTADSEANQPISLPQVYRDRQWLKAIAITVEAADAPQRHESSPILITML